MYRKIIIIIACCAWLPFASSANLPADIKKCNYGDYVCIRNSTNHFIRRYGKGYPEIGMEPLDHIKVDDISLIDSPGPLWISYKLKNQVLKGMENLTVKSISGFDYHPENTRMVLEGNIPRILMEGEYEFQGKGLIVYSNTSGKTNTEMLNVNLTALVRGYFQFRNNKRHLKIYDLVTHIKQDRWILWADDLYKENTDLTVVLNRVVNENWLEFWNEVEATVLPVYSKSISKIFDNLMATVPYDDMFLPKKT